MADVLTNGPDLSLAEPLAKQLHQLDLLTTDAVGYAQVWVDLIETAGDVYLTIARDGAETLMVGQACDGDERERRMRLDGLCEHMRGAGFRDAVKRLLLTRGRFWDDRPNDARETTRIVRAYLANGGRLLIRPDGQLTESMSVPPALVADDDAAHDRCFTAHRDFYRLRRRHRSQRQVHRAVRLLGTRTDNGWIVLEGEAA